jgi:hypothetical protein
MTLQLACRRERDYYEPYDYEFHTNNPYEYWILSYCPDRKKWFAELYEDIYKDGVFDVWESFPHKIPELLEALPISALPVGAFI